MVAMLSEATPLIVPSEGGSDHERSQLTLQRARSLLYTSHFFAQFSQQSWEFGLTLFLAAYTDYKNLALVSSYGIVTGLVMFATGSTAGKFFVDTNWNRLSSARFLVWTQNGCVIIATALSYALLKSKHSDVNLDELEDRSNEKQRILGGATQFDIYSVALIIGLHIFGPLSSMLDKSFLVSIERDWVVVMGEYACSLKANDVNTRFIPTETWLFETNISMKQIDLGCRIAAPSFTGLTIGMVEYFGFASKSDCLAVTALLIGVLNGIALLVEYFCTSTIYNRIPSLALKFPPRITARTQRQKANDDSRDNITESSKKNVFVFSCCGIMQLTSGLRIYLTQPISWAGVSLAILYFNTLTFGSLMTAYLLWRGMTLETVGVWRGVSSALGLAGTFAFRLSTKRLSLVGTGMWSVIYQLSCIMASTTSFLAVSYNLSMTLLIAGVCASRIGLWVFDVAVTQLMQELIPEGIRGSVGGTQNSLNAFFQLSSFCLGLLLPSPQEFNIYAVSGCISVALAAGLYSLLVFPQKAKFVKSECN